jgi:hypothetical protein
MWGFVIVFGIIIFSALKRVATWNHNNQQPEVTVSVKVSGKRTEVRGSNNHSSTYYFATFQFERGDRNYIR